jgi:hypothetical protein
VVTEILTQLVAGAPQQLNNSGLPLARLRWADAARRGAGLVWSPPGWVRQAVSCRDPVESQLAGSSGLSGERTGLCFKEVTT